MRISTSFLAVFVLSVVVWAKVPKVLLVSDIDDTIKVSHVLSTLGKISRAADVTTPFLGMASLYQLILNENPSTTKIVYLSNAPDEIGGVPALKISHQTFLKRNHFPAGDLLLRDGLFEKDHKLKALRELIDTEMPDVLILIGDNGEKDILIYDQIVKEYAYLNSMKTVTFIHQLYATEKSFLIPDFLEEIGLPLLPDQVAFVTPVEISLKLNQLGFLSSDSVDWMIQNIAPQVVSERRFKWDGLAPITFPAFKNCHGFEWSFFETPALQNFVEKIERECN